MLYYIGQFLTSRNTFMAHGSLVCGLLYREIYFSWCHFSQTKIWPTEHVSGPKVLDVELSKHTHRLQHMLPKP